MKSITYYKLIMTLESPLAIGSGKNESTDKDVLVDKKGDPFIPATAIAGVLRSPFGKNDKTANAVFGNVTINTDASGNSTPENADESKVKIYDALYDKKDNKQSFFITARDNVALTDKVAVDGAKFDFEAVEPGSRFVSYIEFPEEVLIKGEKQDSKKTVRPGDMLRSSIAKLNAGVLRFGGKTTRGYGKVSVALYERKFSLPDELAAWLDYNMFEESVWNELVLEPAESEMSVIKLILKNKAGISIREYSTDVSTDAETMPDYRQLALHDEERTPVIPGSSWAGAFRERFTQFTDNGSRDDLFGYVYTKSSSDDEKENARKSRIVFSESRLSGGKYKQFTRNSIDRFSAATRDGSLYSELTYYGGTTELEILVVKDLLEKYISPLSCVIKDLHNGYLSVGGLTAVGRGLFEVVKMTVDGKDLTGIIQSPNGVITKEDLAGKGTGGQDDA